MIVVMKTDAGAPEIDRIVERIEREGGEAVVSHGSHRTIVGLIGDAAKFTGLSLDSFPGVDEVLQVSASYKLVSREGHPRRSTVSTAGVPFGPGRFTVIAGPCAVESPEQALRSALMAKSAGATILRGGAFKPRTPPYAFQGLGRAGLEILAEVGHRTDMPVVTEVMDTGDVELVSEYSAMLQVGARNMQNFSLLRAVGSAGKPVLLKRGLSATVDEWLNSAEYIAQSGNLQIVLCERGIRTFERATRNTLDVSAVAVAQRLSHLPVVVDPSHSGGRRELVLPLSRAAIGVGADGLIVDVHPSPEDALCDGSQALAGGDLAELGDLVRAFPPMLRRTVTRPFEPDTAPSPVPVGALRDEIDAADEEIRTLVRRRTELSRRVVAIRSAAGGAQIAPAREQEIIDHYAELGADGQELARTLLRLGRGPDRAGFHDAGQV